MSKADLPVPIANDRIEQIKQMMWDIPFGNTRFQIETFLREYTPERQLRMILLQMNEKIGSLEKFKLQRKRIELDLEELNEKIETSFGRERSRLELDLAEKKIDYDSSLKLVNDTIAEIQVYDALLREVEAAIGKVDRESFERAEQKYWELRLLDDARANMTSNGSIDRGTLQSLQKIGLTAIRGNDGITLLPTNQALQIEQGLQDKGESGSV